MKIKSIFICTVVLAMLLLSPMVMAHGDGSKCELVYLFNAWARSTPEGAPHGAVFGFLVNLSDVHDTLVGARTDVADTVELHETIMGDNDVMQMRPVEGGFSIEPDSYLELRPGGLHIMLINLKQPLEAGSTLDLILNFEHAGEVPVTVPIREMMDTKEETGMHADKPMQPVMTPPAVSPSDKKWNEACAKMHVVGAWARPTAPAMPNSAVYALLLNLTDTDDTLIKASTDVSRVAELHEMVMGDNDVMQMRPIEDGISVPAGGAVLLQPGGLHVMLIDLEQGLKAGATLDLTLTFAKSGDIELTVPILEPQGEEMPMSGMSEESGH